MPRSDWALVSKHEFLLPRKIKEQQKIGMFFRALDDLIALHQCKYFYASPKSGIFHNEKTNPWEQRKLGEISIFNPKSELPEKFEYVDLGKKLRNGFKFQNPW